MNPRVVLDMDGVLANFVLGATYHVAKVFHPKRTVIEHPYSSGRNSGEWNVLKLLGVSEEQFWSMVDHSFWAELPPMPYFWSIVDTCTRAVGEENICIASVYNGDPGECLVGKLKWLNRFCPELAGKLWLGKDKAHFAAPNALLVDDNRENCDNFRLRGGRAMLVPRVWNHRHALAELDGADNIMIEELKGELRDLLTIRTR